MEGEIDWLLYNKIECSSDYPKLSFDHIISLDINCTAVTSKQDFESNENISVVSFLRMLDNEDGWLCFVDIKLANPSSGNFKCLLDWLQNQRAFSKCFISSWDNAF